jgi:hypothetical protein
LEENFTQGNNQPITACKQYCLAAGATQGNIAYTQNVIGHFKQQTDNIEKQMRPLIFDMLFNDDRKFVMEISRVTVNGEPKWAVITRRNVPDYPAFRSDSFETREEALEYYKNVVVETPLVSLNGQSPNPRKTIEEYKQWLIDKGLTDNYL